jgi:hypothetical protein
MPAKAAGNVTLTYNSVALTDYLDDISIEAVVKELITTVLSSTGETKIPGVANYTLNIGGPWAKALDDALAPDAITPPTTMRTLVAVYGVSGSTVTLTWTTNAFIGNYKVNASNPTELIKWTGVLAVSGVPVRS